MLNSLITNLIAYYCVFICFVSVFIMQPIDSKQALVTYKSYEINKKIMNKKNQKKKKKLALLKLFENSTKSQISWNLIVHKELSGIQLSKLLQKNISTITRNLKMMKEENLVLNERTEMIKNFQVKYWKLNPSILNENLVLSLENQASQEQLNNILTLSQGIIKTILESAMKKRNPSIELLMLQLDKKTAEIFDEQLMQFVTNFMSKYQSGVISNLEDITSENNLFFFISSQIKNSVSKLP